MFSMSDDATLNQNNTPPDFAEDAKAADSVNPPVENTPPPPSGDSEASEKYLQKIKDLISGDKIEVFHTDLEKFNIEAIEDHYRLDLGDYEVEINHSKAPDTSQDFYIMLFNNIKKIEASGESCINKVILAYVHLTENQFEDFKETADGAIERKRKAEEEKRFKEAMEPIDQTLNNLGVKDDQPEPENFDDFNDDDLSEPKPSDLT
jgi:hypothetical protein